MPRPQTRLTRGSFDPIPREYAKPYRKTAFLFPHPSVVNNGFLHHEHGRRFAGVIQTNQDHAEWLTDLRSRNEVSFSADRVKDARGMGFPNQITQGFLGVAE